LAAVGKKERRGGRKNSGVPFWRNGNPVISNKSGGRDQRKSESSSELGGKIRKRTWEKGDVSDD